jgi:queuine tRNA-ribosyltransferase
LLIANCGLRIDEPQSALFLRNCMAPAGFQFEVLDRDRETGARVGRLTTWHGAIDTPVFMPVGTQATVKGLVPEQLRAVGVQILLANTYHLALRPGSETVASLGGLHRMMGWDRPILTDSGGFQVFSLAERVKITDMGATFQSHIDGARVELTPERAIRIQEELGADIIMCLDECPSHATDRATLEVAVRRTTLWATRCRAAHQRPDQALFGIVQGGVDLDLRAESAAALRDLNFPGYAVGGLSVGESRSQMLTVLDATVPLLPDDRPHYLMGVGRPQDIVESVARGIDMFDCVLPTRNGRNATAFTASGPVKLRNAVHQRSTEPVEPGCPCPTCRQFSRGYLRHLFQADEMLGPILLSLHNVSFFVRLMAEIRAAIAAGTFDSYRRDTLAHLGP